MIGVMIMMMSLEIDAQPTVDDDDASCQSSTLDEAVNLIREDLKDVKQIKKDLTEVKNLLGSRQQQTCSAFELSGLCE